MTELAIKLLVAHLLGDFVLQPDTWVRKKQENKHRSPYLYYHLGVHALSLLVLLQFDFDFWLGIVLILITHFLIDLLKVNLNSRMNPRILFLLDQLAHLVIIFVVVFLYDPFSINFQWLYSPSSLLFLMALLTVSSVSAVLMKVIMSKWQLPEDKGEESLPKAGEYIGILERLLVFIFIVLQQWSAIGWLIAAKSVFRFSDLTRSKDRKLTEYILIGTLWSFGLAILAGLAYSYALLELLK